MVNQYNNPKYAKVVDELKKELKKLRKEVGEDDSKHPHIHKIIEKEL